MRRHAGPAIEVQPRLATLIPDRWPAEVIPAQDELLSSWLHRLALAHGLSPRHFGDCLGFGAGAWSARLDLEAAATFLNLLHCQTGVCRDRIAAMTIGARDWRPLLLPLRHSAGVARASEGRATWLQFCPECLADDEAPYFRRAWRRASVMTCRRHGRRLSDRCPACRQGLAPFNQCALAPQSQCAVCGVDLRQPPAGFAQAPKLAAAARKAVELIDDLVRIEAAKGFLARSALSGRLLALPSLQDPPCDQKFTNLSTAARFRCLIRLESGCDPRWREHLCADSDPVLAAWRRAIVTAGGIDASLQPLVRRLARCLDIEAESPPRRRKRATGEPAADLRSLLAAYGAIHARQSATRCGAPSTLSPRFLNRTTTPGARRCALIRLLPVPVKT